MTQVALPPSFPVAPSPPPAANRDIHMRPLPEALVNSVRTELLDLVNGDLEKNLIAIERVAGRARELFGAIKVPSAVLHRDVPFGVNVASYAMNPGFGTALEPSGPISAIASPNPSLMPGGIEQFGAKALRELVNAIPEVVRSLRESPAAITDAIHHARSHGMSELAAKLEAKLLGEDPPAFAVTVAPALTPTAE